MFHLLFFNRFTLDQFLVTLTGLSVHTSDLLPYEEGFKNQLIESVLSSHKPQPAAAVDIWAATRESAATAPALLLVGVFVSGLGAWVGTGRREGKESKQAWMSLAAHCSPAQQTDAACSSSLRLLLSRACHSRQVVQ